MKTINWLIRLNERHVKHPQFAFWWWIFYMFVYLISSYLALANLAGRYLLSRGVVGGVLFAMLIAAAVPTFNFLARLWIQRMLDRTRHFELEAVGTEDKGEWEPGSGLRRKRVDYVAIIGHGRFQRMTPYYMEVVEDPAEGRYIRILATNDPMVLLPEVLSHMDKP